MVPIPLLLVQQVIKHPRSSKAIVSYTTNYVCKQQISLDSDAIPALYSMGNDFTGLNIMDGISPWLLMLTYTLSGSS